MIGHRRDPERVVFAVKTRHLQVAAIVVLGALVGVALFIVATPFVPDLGIGSASETRDYSESWSEAPRFDVGVAGRPIIGRENAPVTIVEFADYGCPYCRRHAREVLPALLAELSDDVSYVVRHFPIPALTPNGFNAAIAAECAFRQGAFWEYKRSLQEELEGFGSDRLRIHAAAVGLDGGDFDLCVNEAGVRGVVERDILDAWEYGVTGTPTFFINGKRFQGARPLEELREYVRLASLEVSGN